MIMSKEKLIKSIREIPDFPIPGILFYDVTTLFKDSERLQELSDIMYEMYKDKGNHQGSRHRIERLHYGTDSCHPLRRRIYPHP